jgi:ElaB/YqjD/DUF883 family membrane-anchored ribosome-binding protein
MQTKDPYETARTTAGAEPRPQTEDVREAAQEVSLSVQELYRTADRWLGAYTRERPYAVLGAAAGIGFVLGGGLASRTAGAMLTVGSRWFANRMLEQLISQGSMSSEEEEPLGG